LIPIQGAGGLITIQQEIIIFLHQGDIVIHQGVISFGNEFVEDG
jgi:hypothetical protein